MYDRLALRGYSEKKIQNNVECEIFQECLYDAKDKFNNNKILVFKNENKRD